MLETFRNLARSVFGMNHVKDTENQYLEVVGNGLDAEHPRNARTLDIAGNEVLAGRLTVGAQPVDDNDVATKKYVDDNAGSGLPSVTSSDNGDVLTVVEGAWAKAAPSGGGAFTIELSYDEGTNATVMNKTAQEIIEAANSRKMLWVYCPGDVGNPSCGFVSKVEKSDDIYAVSIALGYTSTTVGEETTMNYVPTYTFMAFSPTDYPSNPNL